MMGATQNSQSWAIAQPPTKTATPPLPMLLPPLREGWQRLCMLALTVPQH